jgi:hypothetical protein
MNVATQKTAQLDTADIERITGIDDARPVAQRNALRKMGIKAEINAARQVVCFSSWVAMAALPKEALAQQLAPSSGSAEDDDIGLNLEALGG